MKIELLILGAGFISVILLFKKNDKYVSVSNMKKNVLRQENPRKLKNDIVKGMFIKKPFKTNYFYFKL
jgi:hypothetical protein